MESDEDSDIVERFRHIIYMTIIENGKKTTRFIIHAFFIFQYSLKPVSHVEHWLSHGGNNRYRYMVAQNVIFINCSSAAVQLSVESSLRVNHL